MRYVDQRETDQRAIHELDISIIPYIFYIIKKFTQNKLFIVTIEKFSFRATGNFKLILLLLKKCLVGM